MPFRTVALHGLVRDECGKKMSKSAATCVDPLDWIDEYGADALRFTLARGRQPRRATSPIGEDWVAGHPQLLQQALERHPLRAAERRDASQGDAAARAELAGADRWILSRLAAVTAEVDALYEDFEFAKACDALFHFAWDEFFDWYVELAKVAAGRRRTRQRGTPPAGVLGEVLDRLLRLLHPVIPFVTEELWTALTGGESIVIAPWPARAGGGCAAGATRPPRPRSPRCRQLVTEVRRFRSDQGLRPGQPVPASADRDRRHPAGRPRGRDPVAAAADRARRRLRRHRVAAGRRRHGGAGPGGHDRRRGRAAPAGEGPRRGPRRS